MTLRASVARPSRTMTGDAGGPAEWPKVARPQVARPSIVWPKVVRPKVVRPKVVGGSRRGSDRQGAGDRRSRIARGELVAMLAIGEAGKAEVGPVRKPSERCGQPRGRRGRPCQPAAAASDAVTLKACLGGRQRQQRLPLG